MAVALNNDEAKEGEEEVKEEFQEELDLGEEQPQGETEIEL